MDELADLKKVMDLQRPHNLYYASHADALIANLESRLTASQERGRKLREALTTAKYRICCDYCPPDGSHAGLCETISAAWRQEGG